MRRLVKEKLLKFDGTPLFPERRAYTVDYQLSDAEAALYERGHRLRPRGDEPGRPAQGRRARAGGAPWSASRSPSSSAGSRRRRRRSTSRSSAGAKRLERPARRGAAPQARRRASLDSRRSTPAADVDEDVDDRRRLADDELEELEEELVDEATAARHHRRARGRDRHPERPRGAGARGRALRARTASGRSCPSLLQDTPEMLDADGAPAQADHLHRAPRHAQLPRRAARATLLGRAEAVVAIHGGMRREERRKVAGARSRQDKDVHRPGRHRRRRRGHQPPARPPDGQLRPAVEPEPARAALRPHPPHRPDRGLPPLEPRRRGDPRGRRLPAPAREARGAAQGARRPGLRRARRGVPATSRCATC